MIDVIGIEPEDDGPYPCDFCEDEATGLSTGIMLNGITCPECNGTKVLYGRCVTKDISDCKPVDQPRREG